MMLKQAPMASSGGFSADFITYSADSADLAKSEGVGKGVEQPTSSANPLFLLQILFLIQFL